MKEVPKRLWQNLDDVLLVATVLATAAFLNLSAFGVLKVPDAEKLNIILAILALVATSLLLERRRKLKQIQEGIVAIDGKLQSGPQSASDLLINRDSLPALSDSLSDAKRVLICGKTLVNFVKNNRALIEEKALSGCEFRFLLIDPDSIVANSAAESSVSERDISMFQASIAQTLFNLDDISDRVPDKSKVKYKLSKHLFSFSLVVIENYASLDEIRIELYLYKHSSALRPLIVIREEDDRAIFRVFRRQFDLLWSAE